MLEGMPPVTLGVPAGPLCREVVREVTEEMLAGMVLMARCQEEQVAGPVVALADKVPTEKLY